MRSIFSAAILSVFFAVQAWPATIANSFTDFAPVQGQSNWFYGFFNQTANGSYSAGGFVPYVTFEVAGNRWRATDAQVGVQNNQFLNTNPLGGHPAGLGPGGQDAVIWAMRRFVSPAAGAIEIAYDLRKLNVSEPNGGGITGRIFLDGNQVFSQFISNLDGVGQQGVLNLTLAVGSTLDFAIDPLGVAGPSGDNPSSARADGSQFSAILSTVDTPVPEPATGLLFGAAMAALLSLCRPNVPGIRIRATGEPPRRDKAPENRSAGPDMGAAM